MTTTASMIERARRYLMTGHRPALNTLSSAVSNTTNTTLSFTYSLGGVKAGARLSIDTETMYVLSVDEGNKQATVIRGWEGSTAATHSSGATCWVNPQFTGAEVLEALQDEFLDLSSPANGLFRARTVELTYSAATAGYDLTSVSDLIDVLEVRYKQAGSSKNWPTVTNWHVQRQAETDDFASGNALFIYQTAQPGNQVRVLYAAKFAALPAGSSDVETDTGLHAEAHDIPPLGAAIRLTAGRPVKRAFTEVQGEPRRAEEVSTGDVLNAPSALRALRRDRIAAEAARLQTMYPKRWPR